MGRRFLMVYLVVGAVVIAGAMVCWWALHRWQARVLRRERGERGEGFEVEGAERRETR
jgi:hypothetical protein